MHETLYLQTGLFLDPLHFCQRQFSGRHDTFHALFLQKAAAGGSGERHLRTGMQRKSRKMRPDLHQYTDILHDHSVQAGFIERLQIWDQFTKFRLFYQGIHGKIDFTSHKVCCVNSPADLFRCEVIRIGPGAKFLTTQIYGIRARVDGPQESLVISCRSQQFYPCSCCLLIFRSQFHRLPVFPLYLPFSL